MTKAADGTTRMIPGSAANIIAKGTAPNQSLIKVQTSGVQSLQQIQQAGKF